MKTRQFFTTLTLGLIVVLVTLMLGSTFGSVQAYPNLDITPTPEKVQTSRDFLSTTVKTEHLLQTRSGTASLWSTSTGIVNGDFESGPTGWEEYSLQGWSLILHKDNLPVTPHSGNWAVWLGGDNDEISYISQTVTIPSGVTALRFWHWIGSQDSCGYDFAWVRIDNTSLLTVTLCQDNNTGGWVSQTVNIGAYAGRTVSLQFRVETDSSLNSNYFLDDVTLEGATPGDYYVYLPLTLKNFWAGYFDDFSNPNSGWAVGENENVIYRYLNGEYQIYLKRGDWGWAITPDLVLPGDYRIEVDARRVSSGVCSYGLVFGTRWTSDSWETYQVIVWPTDGEFLVNKRALDGSWTTIQDWTYSSAINRNYGTNRIRVDRVGTAIRIYINGTLVANITDSSFTGPGRDAGIRAYSYWNAPVDVRFDNFRASQP
jgi:hypothetical protein